MARSHPPTLLTLVRRTLSEDCALEPRTRVLVAVSGGADSSALLHVMARLRPRFGLELRAHGVDHGLRPEAGRELDLARSLAAALDVPFSVTTLHVAAGGNLQARARAARYAALRTAAAAFGNSLVATAHHADDRAETVLLRLLRGSSLSGLGVLPPRAGDLLRPLVRAEKRDVLAHVRRHRLVYADDPSNLDRRFLRVRVRLELLPLLSELSPGIVTHLGALADEALRLSSGPSRAEAVLETGALELGRDLLSLGRAQRQALERARRLRKFKTRIALGPDLALTFDAASGRARLAVERLRRRKGSR